MILYFSVENYGPFRDQVSINFRPSNLKDPDDNILIKDNEQALSSISLFGPNASGKSRILHAMAVMSYLSRFPLPANVPIPFYNPFRLDPHTKGAPTRMHIEFTENGVKYDYSLSFNQGEICSEELHYSPNGVKSRVFSRNGNSITFPTTSIGKKLSKIKGQTGKNSTFVAVAAQFNNEICLAVNNAMSRIIVLTGDMNEIINMTINRMNEDPIFKSKLIEAMNVADLSITGIDGSLQERHITEMRKIIPDQIIGLMMATGATKFNQMTLNMVHDVSTPGLSE